MGYLITNFDLNNLHKLKWLQVFLPNINNFIQLYGFK